MSDVIDKVEYMSVATFSGHFDARKGWADWEMPSCAAWLSWKCQIASGTAREQVRVARALGALPAVTAEFATGRSPPRRPNRISSRWRHR
jgi:hypothetical protein